EVAAEEARHDAAEGAGIGRAAGALDAVTAGASLRARERAAGLRGLVAGKVHPFHRGRPRGEVSDLRAREPLPERGHADGWLGEALARVRIVEPRVRGAIADELRELLALLHVHESVAAAEARHAVPAAARVGDLVARRRVAAETPLARGEALPAQDRIVP